MTDLVPSTALGRATPCVEEVGEVKITENCSLSIASVALRRGTSEHSLPAPGLWKNGVFWVGPGRWFVTGAYNVSFSKWLKEQYGSCASVVDQTDAWVVFDLIVPESFFERLCNANIRKAGVNSVARSTIEYIGCFIIRLETSFQIIGERSAADSLFHALLRVAKTIQR